MRKTIVVFIFFIAALLAGVYARSMMAPAAPTKDMEDESKEKFMQREKSMPLDMEPVAGYSGTSPILGTEPKPVPEKPYDMADDQKLFQFQSNRVSADCCPSPFSTDRGCVCLTDQQITEFENRGGNRA